MQIVISVFMIPSLLLCMSSMIVMTVRMGSIIVYEPVESTNPMSSEMRDHFFILLVPYKIYMAIQHKALVKADGTIL